MLRKAGGVIVGFVVWSVLWLVAGQIGRAAAPDAFAEDGSTRSGGVLVGLLAASAVCSVAAGWTASLTAGGRAMPFAAVLGVVLLGVGIAVQVGYWDVMPLWYHLVFLLLLVPLTLAGASLVGRRGVSASSA